MDVASKPAPTPSAPELPQSMPALKLYPSLKTQNAPQSQAGPSTTQSSTKSSEEIVLDTKVAEAIAQMRAMGFHDDGKIPSFILLYSTSCCDHIFQLKINSSFVVAKGLI